MGESKEDEICWVPRGESETSDLSGLKVQTWPKAKIWLWKGEQNKNYQFEFEDD
jgi:hypothetical protein